MTSPSPNYTVLDLLETLCRKDASEIISTVLACNFDFDLVLQHVELTPACLFPLVNMIGVVCASSQPRKAELLHRVCRSPLVETVRIFLKKVSAELNPNCFKILNIFVGNLVEFYHAAVSTFPEIAYRLDFKTLIVQTLFLIDLMDTFYPPSITSSYLLRPRLNCLWTYLDKYSTRVNTSSTDVDKSSTRLDKFSLENSQPASVPDFRTTSILPSSVEEVEYPPVEVKGAYDSVDEYLNAHFRTLRANFIYLVSLVREKCVNRGPEPKDGPCRVAASTGRFSHPFLRNKLLCYCVNLESPIREPISCGALALFSKDRFRTVAYAVVLSHNAARSRVYLSVVGGNCENLFDSAYSVAITNFDAMRYNYHTTMKALVASNADKLPLQSYVVEGRTRTELPVYVMQMQNFGSMRSAVLQHAGSPSSECAGSPSRVVCDDVELDQYQVEAMSSMLSQNLTLVHGAPGTGKTFLAVTLIRVLLEEVSISRSSKTVPIPIMVVCDSNRVLDEYILRLSQYTEKIVRIGGKTAYPTISRFNLREAYRADVYNFDVDSLKCEVVRLRGELNDLGRRIREVNEFAGIVSYATLQNAMSPRHRAQLADCGTSAFLVDENEPRFAYGDLQTDDWKAVRLAYWNEQALMDNLLEQVEKTTSDAAEPDDDSECADFVDAERVFVDADGNLEANKPATKDRVTILECTLQEFVSVYKLKVRQMEALFVKYENGLQMDQRELYYAVEEAQIWRKKMDNLHRQLIRVKHGFEEPKTFGRLQHEDIGRVKAEDRWLLYAGWLQKLREELSAKLAQKESEYRAKLRKYESTRDLEVLSKALVIGVTSACATRFGRYLNFLNPPVGRWRKIDN